MSKSRLEWKVGLFVAICLVLIALLIMRFSKGAGLFTPTYDVLIKAQNVGGIIPGANVLMSGVPIGSITEIELDPDGKSVTMYARIQKRFQIRKNAIFTIKQAGFLGDRFISVTPLPVPPGENIELLGPGSVVSSEDPFDMAEAAKTANSLMNQVQQTVNQLDASVKRMDATIFSDASLGNLSNTFNNFRMISEKALSSLTKIDALVQSNTPSLTASVANFGEFTEKLNGVTLELQETLATNRTEITKAIKNIESATIKVNQILTGVEQGQGLAGTLLKNDKMATDISTTVSNLSVFSKNLNSKGLWGVIRKPKQEEKED
ncbi:MAG: MlaD family protein [Verrucomicrobiales bacterium]